MSYLISPHEWSQTMGGPRWIDRAGPGYGELNAPRWHDIHGPGYGWVSALANTLVQGATLWYQADLERRERKHAEHQAERDAAAAAQQAAAAAAAAEKARLDMQAQALAQQIPGAQVVNGQVVVPPPAAPPPQAKLGTGAKVGLAAGGLAVLAVAARAIR